MKKIVSLKTMFISALMVTIMGMGATVFATELTTNTTDSGSVFDTNATANTVSAEPVTVTDYNSASIPTDTNYTTTNTTTEVTDTTNSTLNTSNGVVGESAYNTVDEEEDDKGLPQTGIEDYHIGALLIVCVAAAIYTYRKMKDYKNI